MWNSGLGQTKEPVDLPQAIPPILSSNKIKVDFWQNKETNMDPDQGALDSRPIVDCRICAWWEVSCMLFPLKFINFSSYYKIV